MFYTASILKTADRLRLSKRIVLNIAMLISSGLALTMSAYSVAAVDADNTKNNQNDERKLTPIDQSNDPADIKIAAEIRSAVTADSSLSTNAQNIKVIVQQGVVTLRGPVETVAEKSRIEHLAKNSRGAIRVDNQISVKN